MNSKTVDLNVYLPDCRIGKKHLIDKRMLDEYLKGELNSRNTSQVNIGRLSEKV